METVSGETRNLPQDIIEEILVRMPVKSLVKFCCVSKSWFSLISSTRFIKTHIKYSTQDPTFSNYRLMLGISCDPVQDNISVSSIVRNLLIDVADDVDCPYNPTEWRYKITGSYNGFLCVSVYHYYQFSIEHKFLWNLCLRMSKKLPPLTEEMIVASFYGVGYDEPNDDYKVLGLFVYLCYVDDALKLMVMMYILKNDSWKRIDDFNGGLSRPETSVICANGKFHFAARFEHGDSPIGWNIASLDLQNEVYGTIEQPKYDDMRYYDVSIGVLKGCVSALYSFADDYADVWILKEYDVKESWTKLVRIPYVDGPSSDNAFPHCRCILVNGKYLLGHESQLIVYDPEDKSFAYPRKGNIDFISSMGIYVECLVPLPTTV